MILKLKSLDLTVKSCLKLQVPTYSGSYYGHIMQISNVYDSVANINYMFAGYGEYTSSYTEILFFVGKETGVSTGGTGWSILKCW
jgi:hypothetical protein